MTLTQALSMRPVIAALVCLFLAPGVRPGQATDHELAAALYRQANGLLDQGRFAQAVATYSQAVERDPQFTEVYYNRALASEMVDREKAIAGYLKFIELASNKPDLRWDVARAKVRLEILKSKPVVPLGLQPSHYVEEAGDYYADIAGVSQGELWPSFPVKVFLGSAPEMKWQQGTREAFDIWVGLVPLELEAMPERADIRVSWEQTEMAEGHAGEEADWVRIRRVGGELNGRRIVVINVDLLRRWSKDEMRAIMLHEMGHALGVKGHSPNAGDIMYWHMQEKIHQIGVPAPRVTFPVFWKSLVSKPSLRDLNTLIRLYNSAGIPDRLP